VKLNSRTGTVFQEECVNVLASSIENTDKLKQRSISSIVSRLETPRKLRSIEIAQTKDSNIVLGMTSNGFDELREVEDGGEKVRRRCYSFHDDVGLA
jgi:hypothetical protein